MGYDKCTSIGLCLPILVLIAGVGVHAFEEIDETLYLFLTSHFVPPPPCPENERYSACLGNCPSDCSSRGQCRGFGCPRKGCDCRQNFVRMTPEGACEPVHGCPIPECGENESFRECGPMCETCAGSRCRLLACEHRCYCEEGHLRDKSEKCVPEDQCPTQTRCHRDEELKPSGRFNEYCLRDEDEDINATQTRESCYCREGYSRNTMGHCVADKFCGMTHCPPNEVYQSCWKKCDATCRTYGDASCEEDGQCFPGCFCPEGKVMDDFRRCVTLEDCPPGSNPFARTAAPTSTPAMTSSDATPSTESNSSGSSPVTTDLAIDNYGSTTSPGLSVGEEGVESSTAASTTEAETSEATVRDEAATSPMLEELTDGTEDIPGEDRATDEPKDRKPINDQAADSEQDQDSDSAKEQEPKDQAADTAEEKAANIPKDQALDELKDRKSKDQASDSPKDETMSIEEDQPEASSKAPVQQNDQDEDASGKKLQKTTTAMPKSSKKPGKEKKETTKARKATEPIDEENE